MVDDRMVAAPSGRYSGRTTEIPDARRHAGALLTGDVAWMRPEGRKPYFVGTFTSLTFAFSP
jgi:hypothetical protein